MSINSKSAEEIIRELSQEETVQSTKVSIGTGLVMTTLINQSVRNKINAMGGRILLSQIANGSMAAPTVSNQLVVQNAPTLNTLTRTVQLSPAMQSALGNAGSTALAPVTSSEVVSVGGQNALQVTTHGILTKIPWNAVMGAVAVAQGVKLGVDFVETNPELATKISNRVFGTNIDPSEIANIVDNTTVWANIRDGAIFITQDIIEGIREVFMNEGVYEGSSSTSGQEYSEGRFDMTMMYRTHSNPWKVMHQRAKLPSFPAGSRQMLTIYLSRFGSRCDVSIFSTHQWLNSGSCSYNSSYADNPVAPPATDNATTFKEHGQLSIFTVNGVTYYGYNSFVETSTDWSYYPQGWQFSVQCGIPFYIAPWWFPNAPAGTPTQTEWIASILQGESSAGILPYPDNVGYEKIPNAIYPTIGGSTATDYPDWWNKRTETYKQYNEEDDEDLNTTWMPVSIFDPATQNDAQQGTFSDDNVEDIVTGIDETLEDNPDNNPQTDPQEQEYPNPNPEPSPTLEPITPTPPTIDISDGESPDPTTPILTTAITSGLSYIYNPTLTETRALGRKLWTLDFVENLKKIFVDPMQAIIGFHILYATPKTGERKNIVLGFYDTEVQSKIVTNQYVTIDCGTIRIGEYFNDARDYETFTSCSIYLPFIGVVDVKADDIINSYTNITYHVDVLTGTCLATVQVTKQNAKAVIYQFVGNCAVTIPLTSGNYTAVVSTLLAVASSAVGGGMAFGAAGAIFGAARSAAVNAHRAKFNVIQSGNLGSNAGAMGIRKPYIIIRRPVTTDAYAYNMQYGYPANKWVLLSNVKDFTRVRSIHLENVPCTDEEKSMIEDALKEGAVF